jgi:hypothetical protein
MTQNLECAESFEWAGTKEDQDWTNDRFSFAANGCPDWVISEALDAAGQGLFYRLGLDTVGRTSGGIRV